MLISLPAGLALSGITTWAFRLARELSGRGHSVTIMAHRNPGPVIDPGPIGAARLVMLDAFGSGDAHGAAYQREIDRLHHSSGAPVMLLPSLSVECYSLCAGIARSVPRAARIVAWTHNDIEHDYRLAQHFEPVIAGFVGVSTRIAGELTARLPARGGARDIHQIPYGVEIEGRDAPRGPTVGCPLRLIYTGRMDQFQKRVHVLVEVSRALSALGREHEMLLVGDGPAAEQIDHAAAGSLCFQRISSASGAGVAERLGWADLFLLPSRFEGLSIAMLEAMARGCVPVVTDVASGARDAIEPGISGALVDASLDDRALAKAMARAILDCERRGLHAMSLAARQRIKDRFSLACHSASAAELFGCVANSGPRAGVEVGAFSVPADAAARAREALAQLSGRRVAVWGAGRHTRAIAPEFARTGADVLAAIDDDPANWGGDIVSIPIGSARHARSLGATDVLISSAMHEAALWSRRAELERLGFRVHRMYAAGDKDPKNASTPCSGVEA